MKSLQFSAMQSKSNVAVLLPSSLTESFELVLSRIVDLNEDNENVTVIVCNGRVKGCVSNYLRIAKICQHCCNVRDKALKEIGCNIRVEILDDYFSLSDDNLYISGHDAISVGVLSTILTFYRRDISTSGKFTRKLFGFIEESFTLYSYFIFNALSNFLLVNEIKRLEFFNGRIVPTRVAWLVAKKNECDYGVIEVDGQDKKIFVTENNLIHDINYLQERLKKFIGQEFLDIELGSLFFEARRGGKETNDKSFTNKQKLGLIKKQDKAIFAVFTSSADELKVSGDQWFTPASLDPTSFIIEVASLLKSQFNVVVRMHPNQAGDKTGASNTMIEKLSNIENITLLTPKNKASSYELIDAAEVILTFGSTMGLEATYWGKPSILAGRALWDCLDIAYKVDTPADVYRLIRSVPMARSRYHALAVGAYFIKGDGWLGSLSWKYNGITGFSVHGRSYITEKRSSFFYWLFRAIDRVLMVI